MGKKRTPGRRREVVDHSGDYDNRTEGKINAINTWNDIEHDEEDQFHEDREKVLLGYEKQMRGDDDGMYRSLLLWSSTYTAIPFGSNSFHFVF
ncbi:unnamed protein product [Umbelopsis ramanniana]